MDNIKNFEDFLDRMQGLLDSAKKQGHIIVRVEDLENTFPELRESEDERIRKAIHIYLDWLDGRKDYAPRGEYTIRDMIAWLEKQSTPQVRTGLEWVNTIDDACDKRYAEEYAHGEYCHEQSFKWGFQEGVDWLEKQGEHSRFCDSIQVGDKVTRNKDGVLVNLSQLKRVAKKDEKQGEQKSAEEYTITGIGSKNAQGKLGEMIKNLKPVNEVLEQKSADKVEPKFHKGQWITNGDYTWQIVDVTELDYILQSQEGNKVDDTISHVDEQFHVFSIQDAKDGDVLACESGWACIFKALDEHINTFSSYCFMDKDKWFCETGSKCHTLNKEFMKAYNGEIKPATKEQRDTLLKSMADAGYTFDFEKKELKKL